MERDTDRTIVIGDIHGCCQELKGLITLLLDDGRYRPGHDKLIFLGDYIDRGKDSRSVIRYIRDLQKANGHVIALMGNHEDMFVQYRRNRDDCRLYNGCQSAARSYLGHENELAEDEERIRKLPLFHEDDHFVYVHAGIDPAVKRDPALDKGAVLLLRQSLSQKSDLRTHAHRAHRYRYRLCIRRKAHSTGHRT